MADYLRAECTKAFRRKYLYIALLVCLAGESLLLLGSWLTYSWGNTNISFHSTAVMVAAILSFGLYATLITGDIVFSDQYKHNTLKNEVSYGLPWGRIYLGKLCSALLAGTVLFLLTAAVFFAVGFPLSEHRQIQPDRLLLAWAGLLTGTLSAFPRYIGAVGLAHLLCFSLRSSGLGAVVYYGYLTFGELFLSAAQIHGLGPLGLLINSVAEAVRPYLLTSGFFTYGTEAVPPGVLESWITGLLWLLLTSAVGLVLFRRREIR